MSKQLKLTEIKQQNNKVRIKAEELAKELRSVSVSEFFERNRHLLGYDNQIKALLTVVKEAVDNSLTWDMPILLRVNGEIKIVKIGEFIDEYLEKNKIVLREGDLEKRRVDNIEALTFDKDLKLSFKKVSTLFRHKVNSPIYRIKLESGRYVDLTEYHSVFSLKKGKIVSVKTNNLKEGDFIVVPRKEWSFLSNTTEQDIDLLESLISLPEELTKNIFIHNISLFFEEIRDQLRELVSNKYRLNDFKRFDYLPFNLFRKCLIDPSKLENSTIGYRQGKIRLPTKLKIDNNLVRLLGLYVAEGSTLNRLHKVYFSYGAHEEQLIKYTSYLIEKVFGFKPAIDKAHNTAVNVIVHSTLIGFLFKYVFNFGTTAKHKKVSPFIFSLDCNLKKEFLLAYLAGDGYPSKRILDILLNKDKLSTLDTDKITLATASYELFITLQYLLSSLSYGYSVGASKECKRIIKDKLANFSQSYYIYVYTNQKKSTINKVPYKEILKDVKDSKLAYSINRDNQECVYLDCLNGKQVTLYEEVKQFMLGDLGVLKIKKIKKINYDKDWVYDISIPGYENFVAGVGPILCHNSLDACEEAKILPDIKVEIEQLTENRFKIIVEDNGPGIVKKHIPNVFAQLLYGSKFHRMKQSRGIQGIGISSAVLYAQLTTGKSTKITSKIDPKKPAQYYELHIDTVKNLPEIVKEEEINWNKDHGIKIELEIEAKYQKGKQSVDEYLKQVAIINPHVNLSYLNPNKERLEFPRAVEKLPKEPKQIKPHPYGVELGILIRMLRNSKSRTLQGFLSSDFSRISNNVAKEICDKANLPPNSTPFKIAKDEADKLFKAIQETKIRAPPTDCLSPIGEDLILKGLKKEVDAEFFTATTRPPSVYRGMPFQVEAAIAYSGNIEKEELVRVLRFANRVPLLYQQSACAMTRSVIQTAWRNYALQQSKGALPTGPAVVLIHIASVWVPFTSESKEAIAHYPEIIKEIKLALQECGRKLSTFIRKRNYMEHEANKKSYIEKYIPHIGIGLREILDLKEADEKKVVELLKELLEKSKK